MFIHQEKNIEHHVEEVWIDLDKILYIRKSTDIEGTYIVLMFDGNIILRISQETFDKIMAEKGVV